MNSSKAVKVFVRKIPQSWPRYEWSLQGFGMFRVYITQEIRLHLWDHRFAVPGVSVIHDHPWDFSSLIVAGRLQNIRYAEANDDPLLRSYYHPYHYTYQTIKCGPGGCALGDEKSIILRPLEAADEAYIEGDMYLQAANEIHESRPHCGTVTLVERTFKPDTEHARVFYPTGTKWVSAEPREANLSEIKKAVEYSLETWFK